MFFKKKNDFAKASAIMCDRLRNDDDLYYGYKSNIAMTLWDRFKDGTITTSAKGCNKAADIILSLIFSIPPKMEENTAGLCKPGMDYPGGGER